MDLSIAKCAAEIQTHTKKLSLLLYSHVRQKLTINRCFSIKSLRDRISSSNVNE